MNRTGVLCLPWIAAALALALVSAWLSSTGREPQPARASLSVGAALSASDTAGYLRAATPREFHFPTDHGAHDGFKTEWWYFTGNVETASGRRFGYQLTFFRSALTPRPVERPSTFAADHAWMAHLTISDLERKRFSSFERYARESGELAGASSAPVRIWLRDWRCDFSENGVPLQLIARQNGIALELKLGSKKPPVLHGEGGLSRKNLQAGNASYYYSLTRLETSGTFELDGAKFDVQGSSWMDREWMTSELDPSQVGWDWFALTLDDGSELMWYRLRRKDGSEDPCNGGSFVAADGSRTALVAGELTLEADQTWTSPRSKANYPAHWRLHCQTLGLELEVLPALADQELDTTFRYWEGAVDVRGSRAGRALGGRGYVELVGYTEQPLRSGLR